ncbi:MAG: GH92 family glycosyl hydrolase [Melioribacteraceae bacterium]|nr:GH92 family glycosyl hydrolase [Melioribacteraceae bacterium]
MKKYFFLLLVFFAPSIYSQTNLIDYANTLIGSDSEYKFSNGNTYPALALPWGMNFWTPQTANMGNGWQYAYDAYKIKGFKQTHQPSPWINDYGAFSIMPVAGELKYKQEERESWFSHKREIAKPYYYQVYLADYDTWLEMTPTERAVQYKIDYPAGRNSYLVLDAFFKNSFVKIIPEENKIIGYCRNNSGGVPENFHNYFIAEFDSPFEEVFTWDSTGIYKNSYERKDKHVGAVVKFKGLDKKIINIKIASSFISPEQAQLNLDREIGNNSFEQTKQKAFDIWNKEFNKIKVEGGTEAEYINFYSAFYRTLLFPRKFYEINKDNEVVHYSPYNGDVLPGYMFTDNGFWDTFRAVFPFITLMYPEHNSQIMQGLVNTYNESGWLPEWASPGHRDCMIGSNSASLIGDSYLKGIRGYDINTLYDAITKNADNEGPLSSVGRLGAEYYNTLGYIPYDVKIDENAARTLEYSYADFVIWRLAKELNRPQKEIDLFAKRALNYENVFDKNINFMRGRNKDGSFQSPFRADKWGDAFTEGCSWHWTWCVFHDPKGLSNLMGGDQNFLEKLDSVFIASPTFDFSYYGVQIHEITEMLVAGMGQYAHGNQPIQHAIYLYNYVGAPWKAQQKLREVMNLMYKPTPDGLCGDEDNGQTSAWYVFSALGFYPVAPGTNEYVFGSLLFKKATLQLENGKQFVINAENNSSKNIYTDKMFLNGKDYSKTFITHEEILRGGTLNIKMSSKPNLERGNEQKDRPYSYSTK